ncbi:odorant receptor 13a [Diachasma alloeum]|uniref:Odorant receptor n=1 Tax=Diachasma alloeum TaxID=454923 RepID=A0A4E0RZ12_9HYME|nr:odorant receptor 13a [Diachasma alloeum]THK33091.1 odorant receptor 127 [Diachasma alloeum]
MGKPLDIEDFVMINRKILEVVGLYPRNCGRYVCCVVFMSLIVVPEALEIYYRRSDFDVVLETSSVLLTIILAILKSVIWISRRDTSDSVGFLINDYWKIANHLGEPEDFYKSAKAAKVITMSYSFLICNALLFFYSLPLLHLLPHPGNSEQSERLRVPFLATYPEFCYHSPAYEFVYISQLLATSTCALIILATDTLIATALLHTCGHFAIIERNISELNFAKSVENLEQRVRVIIKHHQLVIRFSDRLEFLFNPLMFLQVFASSLIICLVGFQAQSGKLDKFPQYCSYLMMALFQLLLFCWPGDELITQSSRVSTATFSANWYIGPNHLRKDLQFIILRSQKSNFLSAGKLSAMNLENFSAILSSSLSYFMLLRSFSEN